MKTNLLFLIICFFSSLEVFSQDTKESFLYFDAGTDFILCAPPSDKPYLRGDVNPDPFYYEESYLAALMYKYYFGAKFEKKIVKGKLGIASGLRYTNIESSIGKNTYWSSGTDELYLLYKVDGTVTEYLKVKNITTVSKYLGIPFEIRIYPYEQHFIQMYYKLGFDFNILLNNTKSISFSDPKMKQYENEATQPIEDPWEYYASIYIAAGLKIGKESKPNITIEACGPSGYIYNTGKSSFVEPYAGIGIQINLKFPL